MGLLILRCLISCYISVNYSHHPMVRDPRWKAVGKRGRSGSTLGFLAATRRIEWAFRDRFLFLFVILCFLSCVDSCGWGKKKRERHSVIEDWREIVLVSWDSTSRPIPTSVVRRATFQLRFSWPVAILQLDKHKYSAQFFCRGIGQPFCLFVFSMPFVLLYVDFCILFFVCN